MLFRCFNWLVLILALFGLSCVPVSNVDFSREFEPDEEIRALLPLQLDLLTYVAVPRFEDDATRAQIVKQALGNITARLLGNRILKKYFRRVEVYGPRKKGNLIVFLTPGMSGYDGNAVMTIKAEIFNGKGELVYRNVVSRSDYVGRKKIGESLVLAAMRAEKAIFDHFVQTKRQLISQYIARKPYTGASLIKSMPTERIKEIATASGFFVNPYGDFVTNYHAVKGCLDIRLLNGKRKIKGLVKFSDEALDLAVLRSNRVADYARFSGDQKIPRLGDDILVLGYPLQGVLTSNPSLTKGTLSALAGIKDDDNVYQISAPIQKGNSGGPLINNSGQVIGVVQGKLRKSKGLDPQNVNFAIKRNHVVEFLKKNKIRYATSNKKLLVHAADIAESATKYTYKLSCLGYVVD